MRVLLVFQGNPHGGAQYVQLPDVPRVGDKVRFEKAGREHMKAVKAVVWDGRDGVNHVEVWAKKP